MGGQNILATVNNWSGHVMYELNPAMNCVLLFFPLLKDGEFHVEEFLWVFPEIAD